MVHMIEEGFRNSICFGCLSLKWHQAASKSFFVNESSIEGTIATSGDKTKQLRKLVNGSVGRYSCLLQYLFWLLASKMTSGSLRPKRPYLDTVRLCRVKHLDNASIAKCRKVNKPWKNFLDQGKVLRIKIIRSTVGKFHQVGKSWESAFKILSTNKINMLAKLYFSPGS